MNKLLITTILLVIGTLGLTGCSETTARHDNERLDVQPVSDEYVINRTYEPNIDINWPY